jgi:hypothetical protein
MTYIFLGPSLGLEEARKVLDAQYLPPARLGDILSLVKEKKPKIIGLIDGYFSQTLPVWHKEILYALQENVAVLGASSMGALRAAETDFFGMVGLGKIYEMFRDGELSDDDEVALAHGSEESHFLNFSLPMVNIRETLKAAAKTGLISNKECETWTQVVKNLYYPHRTIEEIVISAELSEEKAHLFRTIFKEHYIDQKKEDALLLLRHISEERVVPPASIQNPMHQTPLFQQLFFQDRSVFIENRKITLRELAKYIALHHADFYQIRTQALNRILASMLAKIFSIQAEPHEVEKEKERFLFKHGILFPYEFEKWLQQNHLSNDEFEAFMKERAILEKLYASPLGACASWRLQKTFLDELKLCNQYTDWAARAAKQQTAWEKLAPYYFDGKDEQIFNKEIFTDHVQHSEWDLNVPIRQWCDEAGFFNLQELAIELHKSRLARNEHSQ